MSGRSPYRAEILAAIDATFLRLKGRTTSAHVQATVYPTLTGDQKDYLVNHGLRSLVAEYFRQRSDDGLPQAPEVSPDGTHCQMELLSLEEHGYVIRKYAQRSNQNLAMAYAVAKKCKAVHGVWIEPRQFLDEASGS